ncbi:hypothetical protein SPRG_07152 [Saprolegnia parasitica CBS 223.65]|uniref:Xaa-Pro dipeptidyl-peptidase C-terminal domain-containing protein n=1 Tax=Saprolegnia parasitica (strain CBS 223.65) TaxID=695850 RepID=A0A067CFB8_SAPPC|nr:hypothetical protein SPRG_07152 [Saprolegnia parasitica CBS 223.65]KDO27880.1 hypothetical protein SPRG_07152 [Saprolegnia parasitica CBS 223.65]|eukprot:XP_012201337.1 hypothetical protein SPRG_07152 [Saprolegnia parasitica CBS 223.65]
MADGMRIALDVYLPLGPMQARPVVFNQSRYQRSVSLRWPFRLFVNGGKPVGFINSGFFARMLADGYAVVSMDIRGCGASYGVNTRPWNVQERLDSVEVLDWIVQQPFSNGQIALWGISYEGTAAYLTASMKHPAVKACVPMYMFYDVYHDIACPGGITQHYFPTLWQAFNSVVDSNDYGKLDLMLRMGSWFIQGVTPASTSYADLVAAVADHKNNWIATDDITPTLLRNSPSVTTPDTTAGDLSLHQVYHAFQEANVPTLFYSGWFDATARSALQGFCTLPASSKVVIGPWNHGGLQFWNVDTNTSQMTEFDHFTPVLEFLQRQFQVARNPSMPELELEPLVPSPTHHWQRGVDYFLLGENRWQHSETWPAHTRRAIYYLSMDAPLALTPTLSHVAGGTATMSVLGQKSIGGNSRWHATIRIRDPIAYTHWDATNHLAFASPPLESPLKIVGSAVVTLYIASSDVDADLFVYLVAVHPRTKALSYITEGHMRASHRKETTAPALPSAPDADVPNHSFHVEDQMPLVRDEVACVRFGLLPIAYRVAAGASIQVRIGGRDERHFYDATPSTGRDVTLHASSTHVASIDLPVVATE